MAEVGKVGRVFTPCDETHPDGFPNDKTGTAVTACVHIFCAVVGAGVLALPRVVAWLGWVAGPIAIIIFYIVQLWGSRMLAMVYCVNGVEHARYHHAVKHIMGRGGAIGVTVFQLTNIFLITIAYTITGALSLKTIANDACQINGIAPGDCFNQSWKLTLIFSASEVILSQVPSLEAAWWVSFIGVGTSLFYCLTALVLGLVYSGNHLGTVGGISASNVAKAFGVLNSLGGVAFAYSFSLILMEIQDTLKQPPSATKRMLKAVNVAVTGAFVFYFTVAVTGYVSLGNDVPSMVLEGFPDAPIGVLIAANVCIMLHMVTAYQVFGQPLFDTLESHIKAYRLRKRGVRPTGAITDAEKPAAGAPEAAPYPAPPAATQAPGAEPGATSEQAVRDRLVRNTAPHPTLRPEGYQSTVRISAHAGPGGAGLARQSAIGGALHRMSQTVGMYHVDTGAANETVPLNDEYLLPFWMRLLVRTAYVCITCIIAIVLPFFGAIVGLVGALTFFPLSVFFPFGCYTRVYHPRGLVKLAMNVVWWFMLLVCTAATIAAVREIINGWTNFEIFGD